MILLAMRGTALAALVFSGITTCARVIPRAQKLSDGSYRIACDEPLASCLQAFENICSWYGYDVISATERRDRKDLSDIPSEKIASQAQVRCKSPQPLFGRAVDAGAGKIGPDAK